MIFNIVNGSNNGRAKNISPVELVNFYPEIEDSGKSKYVRAAIGAPGYRRVTTNPLTVSGFGRGAYTTGKERAFFVSYNKLFELLTNETIVERGTLASTSAMCSFADNGEQLLLVDGTKGYILNLSSNVFAEITDIDFPLNPTRCIFTDGYFVVCALNSSQFWFSNSYDGTGWEALDFATAEYSSDILQAVVKTGNGTIWMIGKQTVELWSNVGTEDLPWRRIAGAIIEVGTTAPFSAVGNGANVFWLGYGANGNGSVFMSNGYSAQKISTPAIEYVIKQLTNRENAEAFCYSDEGHSFYVLSFGDEKTIVYDITSNEWHYRGTFNEIAGINKRQQARGYTFFNNKHYINSFSTAHIYEMNLDVYDEDGTPIVRQIVTPGISDENKYKIHGMIELDFERGTADQNDTMPQVSREFSNDSGFTWSSADAVDAIRVTGAVGAYNHRVIWPRNGVARNRVYRFSFDAPIKWVIITLYIRVL